MLKKSCAIFFLLSCMVLAVPAAAPQTYQADANHSTVGFSIPILNGISRVQGKFAKFEVSINYDEKDITKSSVMAKIKADSIDTGIEARDNHLKTADFFDVEKYPEITFESKRVEKRGKGFVAIGTFTMHGVTKELAIPFTLTGKTQSPDNKKTFIGFRATLMIDRREYGVSYQQKSNPNWLGNDVQIELDILATT